MRAGICRAVLLIAVLGAGCATPSAVPPIVLRVADGPVWIYPDEIVRFQCERGPLMCDAAVGRVSQRRCRCVE
jgi:hypothetical protein